MKKLTIAIIVLALLGGFTVGASLFRSAAPTLGSVDFNRAEDGVTNTAVSVSNTTSTTVLATSTSRSYARICNDHATNVVYLKLGVTATTSSGIEVPARTCWTTPDNGFLYTGLITAYSTTTTSTVTVVSFDR